MVSFDNDNGNVYPGRDCEKINLLTPSATSNYIVAHHPRNGYDGNKNTYFALKGGA